MGYSLRFLPVFAVLLMGACTGGGSATDSTASGSGQANTARPSEEELIALLPDGAADCTGRLEFLTQRRIEGQSDCAGQFSGSADGSLAVGTLCVYASSIESKTATEVTASGHFVCSDGNHGVVRFKEKRGTTSGVATATAADGRVVTLSYQ